MVEDMLENDVETVKELVDSADVERGDVQEMIEAEQEMQSRDELLDWLHEKRERLEMLADGDRVEELLSHVEEAYRTAAISEDTYRTAKQQNKELLQNN